MSAGALAAADQADWQDALALHLKWHHRRTLDEVEPTETPGYWRVIDPCGGRKGGCREPIHGCLFGDDPIHHTISFRDKPRTPEGRWASPYRTWRAAREAFLAGRAAPANATT